VNFQPIYDLIDWLQSFKLGGGITLFHVVVAMIGLSVSISMLKGLLPDRRKKDYMIDVICNDCGWVGQVSKFTKVCAQCKSLAVRMVRPEEAEIARKRQRARQK